ncbi:MAG: helix-turn-helix domain-containing protein [Lachnospiraceae bacterium]|nr:helix-turn-helix domain-containing protein [Lachnospiraceae bacterium]
MANHLTQEQIVAKMQLLGLPISRGSYSQIECGIANIRVEELLALSKILSVEINDFFSGFQI